MAWIELTVERVQGRLTGPELTAMRQAALGQDQPDPLPEIIAQVTAETRGYVAACRSNRLGPAGTIPPQLEGAALNLIRHRLATRLPTDRLLTEARKNEREAAIQLLRDVAACRFTVEQPPETGPERVAGPRPLTRPREQNPETP